MWFKGIIMEINDDYAIVMKSDSSMVKVNLKENMSVGDALIFLEEDLYKSKEIIKDNKGIKNKALIKILSIAAALALVLLPMFNSINNKPYAVVSLDINPSIQLELNKKKNIVKASALNADGVKLDISEIEGLSIKEGIIKLKENLERNGYNIKNDKILVGFAFLGNKENVDYEKEIKDIINGLLKDSKIIYLKANKSDSKLAIEKGISLGRYQANQILDDDQLEDKIENMSVEEILNLLNSKSMYLDDELREELNEALEDKLEDYQDNEDEKDDNDDDKEIDDIDVDSIDSDDEEVKTYYKDDDSYEDNNETNNNQDDNDNDDDEDDNEVDNEVEDYDNDEDSDDDSEDED